MIDETTKYAYCFACFGHKQHVLAGDEWVCEAHIPDKLEVFRKWVDLNAEVKGIQDDLVDRIAFLENEYRRVAGTTVASYEIFGKDWREFRKDESGW